MKKIILIFLLLSQLMSSQVDYSGNWKIIDVKTNHVLKGPSEEFELPKGIIGKTILIKDNKIDITAIVKNIDDSFLYENDSPYFFIKEKHTLKIIKDNSRNQFPGDELGEILDDKNKTIESNIGTSFTKLLKTDLKSKKMTCFKISGKNDFNPQSLLITTENSKELFLYSYNDELIFFLKKL